MASIIKKMKGKKAYYYAVKSARVNGNPRIVWQKYLGSADKLIQLAESNLSPIPAEVELFEAGGVGALLSIEKKLGLVELVDEIIPKNTKGPSIGQYILLAAINRALSPKSKVQIGDWYDKTILKRIWKEDKKMFSSQKYWDNMNLIPEEAIEKIQIFLFERMKKGFSIKIKPILYDTTNFFTYINTHNDRNQIAQRGHNKQKRTDLRQVNLALVATKDFQIPLFHKIYQGDIPDISYFSNMTDILMKRGILQKKSEATLVFDKGNFSEENIEQLLYSNAFFIGGAKSNLLPEIFSTPIAKFKDALNLAGTKFYTTECELYGKICKVVLCYSDSFFAQQLASLTKTMVKCQEKLKKFQKSLTSKKNKKELSVANVKSKIKKILSSQHMKDIFKVSVEKHEKSIYLKYSIDQKALDKISSSCLGRTLLISNRKKWLPVEIISAYRDLSNIENSFKNMKKRDYLRWQPAFHWTDQKLNVHAFYCILALLLVSLARKTLHNSGIDISISTMLDELSSIKEVALLYKKDKRLKAQITLSKMSPRQKKMIECLEVAKILEG